MDVIQRIKSLLNERGWTRYRLAKEAALAETTLTNIFKRGSIPSIPTIEYICDAFDISLSEFFLEEDSDYVILSADEMKVLTFWQNLNTSQKHEVMDILEHMKDTAEAAKLPFCTS